MTDPTSEERALVRDALVGIAIAVGNSDRLGEDAFSKIGATKLEKFVCEGLYHLDLLSDVTHSWYLAGIKTDTGDTTLSPGELRAVAPQLTTDRAESRTLVDDRSHDAVSERANEFAAFYESEYPLEDYWTTESEKFLLDFYRRSECVPEEFRDLYVGVQRFRNLLSEVDEAVCNREATLADFDGETPVTFRDRYEEIGRFVSTVHIELSDHEQLRATVPRYRRFTDLLEDAYLQLRETKLASISPEQAETLQWLHEKHYHEAWKLPALVVSVQTATGPRARDRQLAHAKKLDAQRTSLDNTIERAIRRCERDGLVPSADLYPDRDPQIESALEEFIHLYAKRDV
ncbi:MAG: hypothetical protein ABEI99_03555 [Halobaculum sp.]